MCACVGNILFWFLESKRLPGRGVAKARMSQQRSLFSFFTSNGAKKDTSVTQSDSVDAAQGHTLAVSSKRPEDENLQRRQQKPVQNEQFLRIKEKMIRRVKAPQTPSPAKEDKKSGEWERSLRKEIPTSADQGSCDPSVAPATRPLVPGIKRIQDSDPDPPSTVTAHDRNFDKRRKLMQALGADDGLQQGSAWAEARAKFEWLDISRIRDGNGKKPDHPLYDKRTVQVPSGVLSKFSASQKQYWITKCKYMDTLLFFKVGKFYELYEIDAEIGHKELGWKLTISGVGRCRQVGCPESGIDDAVRKLVDLGYKVGRMEQVETGEVAKRLRGPGAMVQRELVEVLTPSTLRDGNIRPEAVHVLALKEEFCCAQGSRERAIAFGFAFADAAAGHFYVGSVLDNSSRSALCALLAQVVPQEVLFESGGETIESTSVVSEIRLQNIQSKLFILGLSQDTWKVLQRATGPGIMPVVLTPLQPTVEFMDASAVLTMLRTNKYFEADTSESVSKRKFREPPPNCLALLKDQKLATIALGALVSHISRLKAETDLLPNGVLLPYEVYRGSLRLDGQTISNLELLENMANGGKAGTLLSYLDGCSTLFGKRLLRRWICHPLQNIKEIEDRLDAVDELSERSESTSLLKEGLQKLPDLERLVARVRGLAASPSLGVIPMAANQVHQRRLKLFCSTIQGVRAAYDLLKSLNEGLDSDGSPKARILHVAAKLSENIPSEGILADIESYIVGKSTAPKLRIDEEEAELDNESAVEKEASTLSRLMALFNQERKYWIDLVEALGTIDVLIAFTMVAKAASGKTCRPRLLGNSRQDRESAIGKGGSILSIKGLWHPYATGGQGGQIVPNDVELGSESSSARTMLLTGPNMGGKSTLLRAACVAVILAQLGSYVPAESCTLSTVDIIFTRLGASDRIMSGESTFMVECSEAASVLQHATCNSLVVLDELGRGTSTFDGYAIAYSVLHDLVGRLDCRLLFATHYHPLTMEFASNPCVSMKHMSFTFVSAAATSSDKTRSEADFQARDGDNSMMSVARDDSRLVFLYSLKSGACQASYGLQVSLLAGIPRTVVKAAERVGEEMHQHLSTVFRSAYRTLELNASQQRWMLDFRASSALTAPQENEYNSLFRLWKGVQKVSSD